MISASVRGISLIRIRCWSNLIDQYQFTLKRKLNSKKVKKNVGCTLICVCVYKRKSIWLWIIINDGYQVDGFNLMQYPSSRLLKQLASCYWLPKTCYLPAFCLSFFLRPSVRLFLPVPLYYYLNIFLFGLIQLIWWPHSKLTDEWPPGDEPSSILPVASFSFLIRFVSLRFSH